MKFLKRVFLVILSAIIIILNICIFALKPIEIRANEIENNVESGAAAIPYIAELIYSLLMTAGVAVGAYELMNNSQTQKDIYRDFLEKIENGTITIPDGGEIEVQTPTMKVGNFWVSDLNALENMMGWTPPTPEQPPEDPEKPPRDEDYWQQLGKQSSFKVNGSMLSVIANYFELLFEEDTLLNQKVFGNPKVGGFKNEVPKVNGQFDYKSSFSGKIWDGTLHHSVLNGLNGIRIAGFYDTENYGTVYLKSYLKNVDVFNSISLSYKYKKGDISDVNIPWKTTNTGSNSYASGNISISANYPIFKNVIEMENYLKTGIIKGCINLDPKVDYQVGINRLTDTLRPLVGTQVSTQALIDTMKKTKTAIKERPEVETEPYIDTFKKTLDETIKVTPVPKPDFKPTLPPTYPEIGTDIPTDKKDTLRDWSKIFPFCIPFDLVDVIRILEAEPKAPRFEWLFKIDMLNFEHLIILDLSIFDEVAKVVRMCELILFIVGLGFTTKAVAKW